MLKIESVEDCTATIAMIENLLTVIKTKWAYYLADRLCGRSGIYKVECCLKFVEMARAYCGDTVF
jgi:hypothetical protein